MSKHSWGLQGGTIYYIAVKVTISPKSQKFGVFELHTWESTGNSYKTIFPIIILMIDHSGQSDYFR